MLTGHAMVNALNEVDPDANYSLVGDDDDDDNNPNEYVWN